MSLRRLRLGEWAALAGAVGLLVTLFLEWFAAEAARGNPGNGEVAGLITASTVRTGWGGVGWFLAALLALLILGGIAVAATAAVRHAPAWPVAAAVFTAIYGSLVVPILAVRLLTQPGLGIGASNAMVDVRLPALLGLLSALLVAAGGWVAIGDERLDARESAYTPPPARPVPGT